MDSVTDLIQQMRQEAADNTTLLHDMIVNMENLGESVKNLQNDYENWGTGENEMEVEIEEDRLNRELQEDLLQEVSSSFPHIPGIVSDVTPVSATPNSMAIPVFSAVSIESGPSLPSDADQNMQKRLEDLRRPAVTEKTEKEEKHVTFNFDIPTTKPSPYPGLDGHPRRITPIPISRAPVQPSPVVVYKAPDEIQREATELIQRLEAEKAAGEALAEKRRKAHMDRLRADYVPSTNSWDIPVEKMGSPQVNDGAGFDVDVEEKSVKISEKSRQSVAGVRGIQPMQDQESPQGRQPSTSQTQDQTASSQISGNTIGTTTVSPTEAAQIRDEVRSQLRNMFPGIAQFQLESAPLNRGAVSTGMGTSAESANSFSFQPS